MVRGVAQRLPSPCPRQYADRVTEGPVHSTEVRTRARRIRRSTFVQSRGFRSSVRLAIIATYSIVFMWAGFFEWSVGTEAVLWTLAGVLWLVVLGLLIWDMSGHPSKVRFLKSRPSLPLLLIAPAFLWIGWWPIVAFVIVIVAYVLELRHHSAGDGFLFSFGLVIFVGVFAGLSMVEIENDNSASSLKEPQDALFWAFASLLKINYGKALTPETQDGRLLATVVGICAILGASLFTATVVGWVIGSRDEKQEQIEEASKEAQDDLAAQLAQVRAELAVIRALLGEQSEDRAQAAEGTVRP